MKEFVIRVRYGGLGDHLLWSHLPRIAKTVGGYEKVYISNFSEYRHPDYKKLVWELNPLVDGFCDRDGECPAITTIMPGANFLDMLMLAFGLDDGSRFHEPEIFYSPRIITQLQDKCVFDPNYASHTGAISSRKLIRYLDESGPVDLQMPTRVKSYGARRDVPILDSKGVFHYCDVIASCRRFYCLTSGGATLAAALRKPSTVFYGYGVSRCFHHSPQHKYVDVSMAFAKLMYPAVRILDKIRC
ncbi:MAG: hypothetical protein JW749_12800 [Sedimentisphaerales bacterium]|nr:hypothetical protein [Sedimentisphaerales bacterium]